jgi:hypothetical protein
MANVINWFEIPAKNFEQASKFYSTVLGGEVRRMDNPQGLWGFLPGTAQGMTETVGGAIVQSDGYVPAANGSVVYLNGGDDLNVPLSRVEKAGGKVLLPKTPLGPNGFMALFLDTEGNKIGFHSMK